MGTSEGEECKQQIKNLFEEIMTEKFPNLVKEKITQVQGAQRFPNKLDLKRLTPRNIIIKMTRLKDKERPPKAPRNKTDSYLQGDTQIEVYTAHPLLYKGMSDIPMAP